MRRGTPGLALVAAAVGVLAAVGPVRGISLAVPTPREISNDPFTDPGSQHATAVEPDSFSFGNTTVGVFQVGRFSGGGASGIGFGRSEERRVGKEWRSRWRR